MSPTLRVALAAAIATPLGAPADVMAQAPTGLAAAALADTTLTWVPRFIPGFRVYFLADSYPALHQDSLLARLPAAKRHAESLLGVRPLEEPIDLFFVETRPEMRHLVGVRATGYADVSARAVFLMTNPEWRAFERHEIMHVIMGQAWGSAGSNTDWILEGIAQAADGRCGAFSNAAVLVALTRRRGWIPFTTMVTDFRAQADLRAYLQAAVFADFLLDRVGSEALRTLWTDGVAPGTEIAGRPLRVLEREWRTGLRAAPLPTAAELATIEAKGCG